MSPGGGSHEHREQDHLADGHDHREQDHLGDGHDHHEHGDDRVGRGHDHDHHEDGHGHDRHRDAHRHGQRRSWDRVRLPHHHDSAETVAGALGSTTQGLRALKASLVVLAVTATLQLLVVVPTMSVALLADTVHNFADALTAVPLGVAFVIGRRPPSSRYTYGYGRAEDLAGICIIVVVALSTVPACVEALARLSHPRPLMDLGWVAAAGVIGFVGNEVAAGYRIRVGRRIGSASLIADGLHARADGLTSLAVVLGAGAVAAGWQRADAIVGLLIALAMVVVLASASRDIYRRLMDGVDPAFVAQVSDVARAVPGIEAVEAVRIRWAGHELWAELEVMSDADLSLVAAHAIGEEAHHRLLHEIPRLARATIHTNPCRHDGRDHHAATAHHFDHPAR